MASARQKYGLDSYLLKVFCLLMSERSVSRAALRMKLSQPAISAALKTLREIFADPLLVRDKGGMVPTERALALVGHAQAALLELDQMVQLPQAFTPKTSRAVWHIGAPDYIAPSFMACVVEALRRQAPSTRLVIHALGPDVDFERALAEGELDVVIGNWLEPPPRLHLAMLMKDEIVCLVNAQHPKVRAGLSLQDYLKSTHLVPMPNAISQRGVIDSTLASRRITRPECVTVQSFNMAPYLLQHTDLIFTTSRHFAQFYADILQLAIVAAPIDFPPMDFYVLWHERQHKFPAHVWLRRILTECAQCLQVKLA